MFRIATFGIVLFAITACNTSVPGLLDEPPPAQVAPPSGTIRIVAPGDFWSYRSTRSGRVNGQPFTLDGTLNMRVEPQILTDAVGNQVRAVSLSAIFTDPTTGESISSVAQLYQSQDPSGAMYLHGELDDTVQPSVTRWVVVPETGRALQTVSPLSVGATLQTNLVEFDDGTTGSAGGVVVSVESVTVPAGTFATYRFEGSSTRISNGTTTTTVSTAWWVPALGAAVKSESATTIRNAAQGVLTTFEDTTELVRTTVPLS